MRCPTCGTENAPDSRFCGACGARVQKSNVAPTHKITDDAPLPPSAPGAGFGAAPASAAPAAAVPGPYGAPAAPPPAARAPVPAAPPVAPAPAPVAAPVAPRVAPSPARPAQVAPPADHSLAPARPRSRTGLILTVLAIDLGLAAAGAWLLREGLAKPEPAATSLTESSPRKAP